MLNSGFIIGTVALTFAGEAVGLDKPSMTSIDDSLREQSKLLLRKLKDKQSKLQDIVNTSLSEDASLTEAKSPPGITYVKQRATKTRVKTPVRRLGPDAKETSVKEKLDTSLQKSVQERSGREGRKR